MQPTDPSAPSNFNQPSVGGPVVTPLGDMSTAPSPRRRWKLPLIIAGVAVVLLGGSAAAYFGYFKNPNVLWGQALRNTQTGYERLVDYSEKEAKKDYKGGKIDGSYKFSAKDFAADGSFSGVSNGVNSQSTIDFGAKGVRMKAELRTIEAANSTNPDLYAKVSGLKGLDSLLGTSTAGTFDSLDNQWFVIDHTLLDEAAGTEKQSKELTYEEVADAARRLGEVNKQYLFTTDKGKAVLTNVKKVGTETRHDRETYRYQATINKEHTVAYLDAAKKALDASKFGTWFKETTGQTITQAVDTDDLKKSVKDEKLEPVDVWVDTGTRTMQNIRFHDSEDKDSYMDIGMLYTGGNKCPFTLGFYDRDGSKVDTMSLTATLDSDKHDITLDANFEEKGGDNPMKLSLNATIKPSNDKVNVKAPSNAKSLLEFLGTARLFGGLSDDTTSTSTDSSNNATDGLSEAEIEALLQAQ